MTIVDVARPAGVSKSTVSLVLSGSQLVAEATRERVTRAMRALGYVYHRGAASLRASSSDFVGMVISDLGNPFFCELAAGIEDALYKLGFTPILANTNEDPARQAQVLRSLREHNVAGIIMSPARGADTWTLAQQWPPNIPAVITMRRMIGSSLPYIGPDNHRGERYAVEHLLRLGHRRIGFIGGDSGMTTQQERVGGWRAALNGWGVAADEALIFEAPPTRDGGRIAIERALAAARPPTAFVCYNDIVAMGATRALTARGIVAGPRHRRGGFRRHRRRRTQCSAADHRQRGYARDGPSLRGEPARPDPTRRSRGPVFRRRGASGRARKLRRRIAEPESVMSVPVIASVAPILAASRSVGRYSGPQ